MAIREIFEYPDPRLRQVAEPVAQVDAEIRQLVEDLAETMYDAPGVGLAATQIGVMKRIFVVDVAAEDEPSQLMAFINPEILELDGKQTYTEGCLSFPDISEDIDRAARVVVRFLDTTGEQKEIEAAGLLAVAVQHENDHLDGKLMIDKMSGLKRRMVTRKMQKRARSASAAE